MLARTEGAGGSWWKGGGDAHTPPRDGGASQGLGTSLSASAADTTHKQSSVMSAEGVKSLPLSTMPVGVTVHKQEIVVTFHDAVQVLSVSKLRASSAFLCSLA